MNASHGRTENISAAEHASVVALESADDVHEKIAGRQTQGKLLLDPSR